MDSRASWSPPNLSCRCFGKVGLLAAQQSMMSGKLHDAGDIDDAKGILDELDGHLVVSRKEELALPIERNRTLLEARLEGGVRGHAPPFVDANQIDEARSDRGPHDEFGVGGRSEAHHKSARLLAAHGLDQTGNARHADHLWIGEGDVEFAEGVRPPVSARTDISIRDEGDVDQRMLRRQSVDDDVEALVGAEGDVFGNVLHDRQACGKAGDSRLAMVGERVVGSRRYAGERHPAALASHRAVCSVATEDHDAGNPSAVHQTRGELGILDGSGNRHVEKGDVRISLFALVTPALDAPHDVTAYPARLGHYQHLLDAAGGDRGKYA